MVRSLHLFISAASCGVFKAMFDNLAVDSEFFSAREVPELDKLEAKVKEILQIN